MYKNGKDIIRKPLNGLKRRQIKGMRTTWKTSGLMSLMGYGTSTQNTGSQASNSNISSASSPSSAFVGNWEETFILKNGNVIRHSRNGIKMDGIFGGTGLTINSGDLAGFRLKAPLNVKTNSTREEFVAALKRTGLLD